MSGLAVELQDINYYFKDIGVSRKAVDYEKVVSAGFPYVVIMTERKIRAKTFGAKEFTYSKWDGKNPNTLWLRNLSDDIKIERRRFLIDTPKNMDNSILKLDGADIVDEFGSIWATFNAVNSPRSLRGSRVYCKYVVVDEFNDSYKFIGESYMENFLNILSSADKMEMKMEDRVVFFLGNYRTLNHPLFLEMGIDTITEEVVAIYDEDDGSPLMLILCPILSDEEIEEVKRMNKENPTYKLAKKIGKEEHMFFNANQLDSVNFVFPYFDESFQIQYYAENGKGIKLWDYFTDPKVFQQNGQVFAMYYIPKFLRSNLKTQFHIINLTLYAKKHKTRLPDYRILPTSNPTNIGEGVRIVRQEYLDKFKKMLTNNLISFENVSSRQGFIDFVLKKK